MAQRGQQPQLPFGNIIPAEQRVVELEDTTLSSVSPAMRLEMAQRGHARMENVDDELGSPASDDSASSQKTIRPTRAERFAVEKLPAAAWVRTAGGSIVRNADVHKAEMLEKLRSGWDEKPAPKVPGTDPPRNKKGNIGYKDHFPINPDGVVDVKGLPEAPTTPTPRRDGALLQPGTEPPRHLQNQTPVHQTHNLTEQVDFVELQMKYQAARHKIQSLELGIQRQEQESARQKAKINDMSKRMSQMSEQMRMMSTVLQNAQRGTQQQRNDPAERDPPNIGFGSNYYPTADDESAFYTADKEYRGLVLPPWTPPPVPVQAQALVRQAQLLGPPAGVEGKGLPQLLTECFSAVEMTLRRARIVDIITMAKTRSDGTYALLDKLQRHINNRDEMYELLQEADKPYFALMGLACRIITEKGLQNAIFDRFPSTNKNHYLQNHGFEQYLFEHAPENLQARHQAAEKRAKLASAMMKEPGIYGYLKVVARGITAEIGRKLIAGIHVQDRTAFLEELNIAVEQAVYIGARMRSEPAIFEVFFPFVGCSFNKDFHVNRDLPTLSSPKKSFAVRCTASPIVKAKRLFGVGSTEADVLRKAHVILRERGGNLKPVKDNQDFPQAYY